MLHMAHTHATQHSYDTPNSTWHPLGGPWFSGRCLPIWYFLWFLDPSWEIIPFPPSSLVRVKGQTLSAYFPLKKVECPRFKFYTVTGLWRGFSTKSLLNIESPSWVFDPSHFHLVIIISTVRYYTNFLDLLLFLCFLTFRNKEIKHTYIFISLLTVNP